MGIRSNQWRRIRFVIVDESRKVWLIYASETWA